MSSYMVQEITDPIDNIIVNTIRMNSPVSPRDLVDLLENQGINERRFYRRIENLVKNKYVRKGGAIGNTIYFVMADIHSVDTVPHLENAYKNVELVLPKMIKNIKKMDAMKMQMIKVDIGICLQSLLSLKLMLMTDLPLTDGSIYGVDLTIEFKRVLPLINNPTRKNIKELIKKIENLLEQYFEKLRKKDHEGYIFLHNSLFNSI